MAEPADQLRLFPRLVDNLWWVEWKLPLTGQGWPILIHNPYRKATTKGTPCVTPGKD